MILFLSSIASGQGLGTAAGVGAAAGIGQRVALGVGHAAGVGAANGIAFGGGQPTTIHPEYTFISTGNKWNARLPKFENEAFGVAMDFYQRLAAGDGILTLVLRVYDSTGSDQTAEMIGASTISGTQAMALVQRGTAPMVYAVNYTVTTNFGHKLEDNVTLYVMSDKLN